MSTVFTSEIGRYIKSSNLDAMLNKLHKNMYISKGTFKSLQRGIVEDFEWNHLDQVHRLYLHDAYHDALRIATSKDIAISLTAFNNLPIYIQVADMRVDRGLFYQSYSILGLLFCHQTIRMIQEGPNVLLDIEWRTVSHKWLRFLHGFFNRKLLKLQNKQNVEDIPVRVQRAALRDRGFHFKTDEPDYFNSNVLTDMVVFPEAGLPQAIQVDSLKLNERERLTLGAMEFFVVRKESEVQVWPALCPHEGAPMQESKFCDGILSCPWHGRKFKSVTLTSGKESYRFSNLVLSLEGEKLVLRVYKPATEGKGVLNTKSMVSNTTVLVPTHSESCL